MTNHLVANAQAIETPRDSRSLLKWVQAHTAELVTAIAGQSTQTLVSVYMSGGNPVSVTTNRNVGEGDEAFCTRHGRRILERMATDPPDA